MKPIFKSPYIMSDRLVIAREGEQIGDVIVLVNSGRAFYKAQEATKLKLPLEGAVLISVSRRDRAGVIEAAQRFAKIGFTIKATEGTWQYLCDNGIKAEKVFKLYEGRPNLMDTIQNGEIQLVVNTPIGKRSAKDDSYIRKAAIKYSLPYITSTAAAIAAAKGIAALREKKGGVKSLQEYHADIG